MKFGMIRSSWLGCAAMILATCGYAGAQSMPENIQLVSANASLVRSIDSKNAAQGQIVTAKLTSKVKNAGSVELPSGTMLIGKVEQVQMSNDRGPSRLSIVFDQARLNNGKTIPIKATLLAAYPESTGDYWADTGDSLEGIQPRHIPADQKVDQEPGTLGHIEMHSSVQSKVSGVFIDKNGNVNLKRGTLLQIAIGPAANS